MRTLQYWHLLSLDAPTVAVVWTWAFAHAAGLALRPLYYAMLGVATWLLYVADRLLDAANPAGAHALHARHQFHARHHTIFLAVAAPAAGAVGWFVFRQMDPRTRLEDCFLGVAAIVYLLCVHLPARSTRKQFPKEAAVAFIFAAACLIPAWSRQPAQHAWLLITGIAFAMLCWLNCSAIEAWESSGADNRMHPLTRAVGKDIPFCCLLLAALALILTGAAAVSGHAAFSLPALSVAASAALFYHLHRRRFQLAPTQLRAAADAVLLTPCLLLLLAVLRAHL